MEKIENRESGQQIKCSKCGGEYFFRNIHTRTWDCEKMNCNTVAASFDNANSVDDGDW